LTAYRLLPTALARRARAVNERAHLADELIERLDAVEHDLDGFCGEAGFERESVTGEDVAGIVRAPIEEVAVAEIEQLAHQPGTILDLVNVDVAVLVVRIDAKVDRLLIRDTDDDLKQV